MSARRQSGPAAKAETNNRRAASDHLPPAWDGGRRTQDRSVRRVAYIGDPRRWVGREPCVEARNLRQLLRAQLVEKHGAVHCALTAAQVGAEGGAGNALARAEGVLHGRDRLNDTNPDLCQGREEIEAVAAGQDLVVRSREAEATNGAGIIRVADASMPDTVCCSSHSRTYRSGSRVGVANSSDVAGWIWRRAR